MKRLGKLSLILATTTLTIGALVAQPTDPNAVWIGLRFIGTSIDLGANATIPPPGVFTPAGTDTVVDLTPLGRSGTAWVLVSVYARATPDASLGRLGLINTFVNVGGISGVSVEDGFIPNRWDGGASNRTDARKNAFSDPSGFGNRDIDSAGNDLKDNSAQPYGSPGNGLKGGAGKSLFPGGLSDQIEGILYSFVIKIDLASAPDAFSVNFDRVGDTRGVPLRTTFGYEFSTSFAPAAYGAQILVPEPASMIALGTGLIGLVALRRRRKA